MSRRVLLVEDDADLRASLADYLELEGFAVAVAGDGAEALLRLAEGPPPQAILLDLMMPGMNGWEFLERRAADPALARIPVVVVSASGQGAAAEAVLRKPVDLPTLLSLLRRLAAPGA